MTGFECALDTAPFTACTSPTGYSGLAVGTHTFRVRAKKTSGGVDPSPASLTWSVIYAYGGFYQPVDNMPVMNRVKAGSAIPVKFSLGGNQGLSIFDAGYPVTQSISCLTGDVIDDIEQTVTAGNSSLSYDAGSGQYTYVWKTDKSWTGTCRQLVLKLMDGTVHTAEFTFK